MQCLCVSSAKLLNNIKQGVFIMWVTKCAWSPWSVLSFSLGNIFIVIQMNHRIGADNQFIFKWLYTKSWNIPAGKPDSNSIKTLKINAQGFIFERPGFCFERSGFLTLKVLFLNAQDFVFENLGFRFWTLRVSFLNAHGFILKLCFLIFSQSLY